MMIMCIPLRCKFQGYLYQYKHYYKINNKNNR